MEDNTQHSNISEEEMGQLHSIHLSDNALARVRARMSVGPGRAECADCGEAIPLLRQQAVQGCVRCIVCQGLFERQ